MFLFRSITGCAAALLLIAGCGGPAHEYDAIVTGTVTIDGELANSGLVTFHPVDKGGDKGKVAIGRIHPDGSYSLRTGQGDLRDVDGGTVVPGDYVVTVSITGPGKPAPDAVEGSPPHPGPSLVATKYGSKETSDLKHTIVAGKQLIVLELERAEVVSAVDGEQPAPVSSVDSAATSSPESARSDESMMEENTDP